MGDVVVSAGRYPEHMTRSDTGVRQGGVGVMTGGGGSGRWRGVYRGRIHKAEKRGAVWKPVILHYFTIFNVILIVKVGLHCFSLSNEWMFLSFKVRLR